MISSPMGDPFVEEDSGVGWREDEGNEVNGEYGADDYEDEDTPQPFMLVRGTKRATLRQSQATAAATSVAKENAGKKKREKNACKAQ